MGKSARHKKGKSAGKLPFVLDRHAREGLIEQTVSGMRMAIASGHYRIGERVPSLNEFVRLAKVSVKVPRVAYTRLVRDGWLQVRHGVGYTATSPDIPNWKGRILFVLWMIGYGQTVGQIARQKILTKAGYRCVSITLQDVSRTSLASLESALEEHYDLVVASNPREEMERVLEASGTPYVVSHVLRRKFPGPHCRGMFVEDRLAQTDLARAALKAGVRTAACVDFTDAHDGYAAALEKVGISVERWRTPVLDCDGKLEGVRRGAGEYFAKLIADRAKLPDLLVFTDDYVADGALFALAADGVRIPRDVRVVTLYNCGLGLSSPQEFARIECCYPPNLEKTIAFLLECLSGKGPRRIFRAGPRFVPGPTL